MTSASLIFVLLICVTLCLVNAIHWGCDNKGRPLKVNSEPILASESCSALSDTTTWISQAPRLSRNHSLAKDWRQSALFEHSSVAAFAHFSLELLHVGAPSRLVELAHMAAMDEIRHARDSFALAHGHGERACGPSPLTFPPGLEISSSLQDIAVRTFRDGCVGETSAVASLMWDIRHGGFEKPVVAVMSEIVADEARHAALAWLTVAWAARKGGVEVMDALHAEYVKIEQEADDGFYQRTLRSVARPWLDMILSEDGHAFQINVSSSTQPEFDVTEDAAVASAAAKVSQAFIQELPQVMPATMAL